VSVEQTKHADTNRKVYLEQTKQADTDRKVYQQFLGTLIVKK